MISAFTGTPGSGKSLHAAKEVIWASRRGCAIVTNTPLRVKPRGGMVYIEHLRSPEEFLATSPIKRIVDARREHGALLLIDEAQIFLNARDWGDEGRREWISFFTQHRKLGFDIILVVQDLHMLDKQIRSLVEYEYVHRNVINGRGFLADIFALFTFGHPLVYAIQKWAGMGGRRIGGEWILGRQSLYRIFDTMRLH